MLQNSMVADALTGGSVPGERAATLDDRHDGPARRRVAGVIAALATVGTRALVWGAGVLAVTIFGAANPRGYLTLPGITTGLGQLGDRLAAPAARWDADWFLLIARHGYAPADGGANSRDAFFPLYPLLVRALGRIGVPLVAGGVLISTLCLALALYGLHLLVALEGDNAERWKHPDAARLTVVALALSPMTVFFSAVYSDSLYLALSVGAVLHARRGKWAAAGALGGLAAATRATGLLLILPLAILYLYGPRADRLADRLSPRRFIPRYRAQTDFAWIGLVPLGVLAFISYLALQGADPLAPLHAESLWGHHFAGPLGGLWDAARSAFHDLRRLLSGDSHLTMFSTDPHTIVNTGWQNLMPFAMLALAVPALIGVARTLPPAYTLYVIAALGVALSEPLYTRPLQSMPRYEAGLFPLFMWVGLWLARHRRWRLPTLLTSGVLAAVFAAEFATWHFVA